MIDNFTFCINITPFTIDSAIFVLANKIELKRILSNLLNNAFESLSSVNSRRIWLSLEQERFHVLLSISDSGIGMSEETLRNIGIKGFSLGKSDASESGQGLGVYHAQESLSSWSGSLTFKSKLSEGTTVLLKLRQIGSSTYA